MIARYAGLYLIHRLFGDGPQPADRRTFLANRAGLRIYETGGFVTHSTLEKFVSFAWANGAMGLVFPGDDTWFTAPYERGLVGSVRCAGRPDTRPEVESHRVTRFDDGFGLTARISRCQGAVRQDMALISLPDRAVIYIETIRTNEEVVVESVRTGAVGILNEDAPGINPNRRTIHHAGGTRIVPGASAEPARDLPIPGSWANIDAKLGVVTDGNLLYRDENRYSRSRLREVLYANVPSRLGSIPAGRTFSTVAVLLLPGATPAETAAATLERVGLPGNTWAVRLSDGRIAIANLGDGTVNGSPFGRDLSVAAGACTVLP